ncbi:hypothetical protein SCB29_37470, partial [Paraburkholderia sp. SIMBA_055]
TIFKIGINAAVENEIIKKNRFKKIKIKKDNPSTMIVDNFFTAEQLSIFLEGAQKVFRTILRFSYLAPQKLIIVTSL